MDKTNWADLTLEQIQKELYDACKEELPIMLEEIGQDPRKSVQNLAGRFINRIKKEEAEKKRLDKMWEKERFLKTAGYGSIAGIDEAGRGPLAGPVVAGCVVLPFEIYIPGLNDSKKVAPQERAVMAELIKEKAVDWGIGVVDHREIDRINILQATKKAMFMAVSGLRKRPDYLLIDALGIDVDLPQEGIIHGDSLSASIAAASIIAKTYRDSLMEAMDGLYPQYGFKEHKGYGTARHIDTLTQFGPCPIHRMSFIQNICKNEPAKSLPENKRA